MMFFWVVCLVGCERKDGVVVGVAEVTRVEREVAPPSGDWVCYLEYVYGEDGRLENVSSEFRTFLGYDEGSEEFGMTRCVREYDVSEAGELVLESKVTTDLASGEVVERSFYDPEIRHWMSLADVEEGVQVEGGR